MSRKLSSECGKPELKSVAFSYLSSRKVWRSTEECPLSVLKGTSSIMRARKSFTSHACTQGCAMNGCEVAGPQVWLKDDAMNMQEEWAHVLTEPQIQELESAVLSILEGGRASVADNYVHLSRDMSKADFPLPTLGPLLDQVLNEVLEGRGFALIKGFPVERWTRLQIVVAYYGIGLHWGKLRRQNKKAHLIGHVKDIGIDPDYKDPSTRVYLTRAAQPYHVDSSDVVGLMCLKTAKEGGMSSWASSFAVYNEMLHTHPHLAKMLAEPIWYLDRKGEVPVGKQPHFMVPIVNIHQGYLSIYLNDGYYQLAQRHADVPRMSQDQEEALKVFIQLLSSEKFRVDYWLQPGDLQILNNHCCIHTRTAFIDFEEPGLKRHLLRLWAAPKKGWLLPDCFAEPYGGSTVIGDRGGIQIQGFTDCIPLEAE
ncbi:hypothetical protein CEUSTIGMA_g5668.t1 [Chlamydomonas eustigma]|uniref:TauD/TfdA-like domain-containing protein n=1 Tax=Chlamydomonas eustigma TaxID=1157962 RepID=A0A250X5A4_9CHLO|nr:hypothetical protein CEUSTIGMA_g5668.t1 [Chlamydomonas eustigma]|eukprot:GAX78226.1 hypothetical protein CEUSTIGMA_g5668.t1 [Chlamydomonas eustigma]